MGEGHVVRFLERLVESELSGWPAEWEGFHWPGYTYEHTLRVRNLSLSMAQQLGADEGIIELAALLHDMGKPAGEPHGDAGAERAERVLSELGVGADSRSRVSHIIRTHTAPHPAYPVENLVLSDADFIDANFGYVAFTRYITIRAHRGYVVGEIIFGAGEWLVRSEAKREKVITDLGHAMARERLGRMHSFLEALHEDLANETDGKGPAIGIARYLAADAYRPSLFRQVGQMEKALRNHHAVNGLQPSPFPCEFVQMLEEEIAGAR